MTTFTTDLQHTIDDLNRTFKEKTPEELLTFLLERFGERIALASSLGLEDQVLTDMLLKINKKARIFTLDTGRLFPETYQLIDKTNLTYDIKMEIYFPRHEPVEHYVRTYGINAFYESIELRHACCACRKLEPLRRALSTVDVWICGLRRSQSVTRVHENLVEWDKNNNLIKVNPLISWTEEQVWSYIHAHHVPYNVLHDKGFPSIGCQPCTRAVKSGEDIRSGRWWWESPEHRECGLHQREQN